MKKFFYILCIALLAAACKKTDDGKDIDRSGYTLFAVDTEEIELVPGERVSDTWKAGDRLSVFGMTQGDNVPYELKRSGIGAREATFYGPVVKGSVLASFPYSAGLALDGDKIPFTLPSWQGYDASAGNAAWFRSNCPSTLATSESNGSVLHFLYPAGLLAVQIRFDEPVYVTEMTLEANRGISGRMLYGQDGTVTPSAVAAQQISQDLGGEAVPSLVDGNYSTFRFVLPPAEYAAGSLMLRVSTTDENFSVSLPAMTVKRVAGSDFAVASVQVGTSLIPVFTGENGYLE